MRLLTRRAARWAATAGIVALGGIGLAAVAAPAADASVIAPNGGGCGVGQANITFGPASVYLTVVQLPGGKANNVQGSQLYTVYCQPTSGTVSLDLQQKYIVNMRTNWQPLDEKSMDLGQTLPGGFGLAPGPVFCSGRHTFRVVLTWHGVDALGNPDNSPPAGISWPSPGGQVLTCIKYGG